MEESTENCCKCGAKNALNYHDAYSNTCGDCYLSSGIHLFVFNMIIILLITVLGTR